MPFESKSKSPNMYLKYDRFIGLPFRQTMSRIAAGRLCFLTRIWQRRQQDKSL